MNNIFGQYVLDRMEGVAMKKNDWVERLSSNTACPKLLDS